MNIFTQQKIEPAFKTNNHLIVLASDNNYAPYLGVCINSIAENCLNSYNYDIVVLETNIHEYYKKHMIKMLANHHNISLRFYNLSAFDEYMADLRNKTNSYFTVATYYRLYAPEIFYNYDRMLYLDCDLAVIGDFSKLLNIDFDDKLLVAVPDITVQGVAFSPLDRIGRCDDYLKDVLKIDDFSKYFQAGVLIFDLKKLRKIEFTKKALKKLSEMECPRWVDQDILNSILYKKVKFIDVKYNYTHHLEFSENNYQLKAIEKNVPLVYNQLQKLKEFQPIIIHFTSSKKPWKYPALKYADIWWQYARQTPFYEEIIYSNLKKTSALTDNTKELLRDVLNYPKNRFNYYRCKLLSKITFGKLRKHYKDKKKKLKAKIRRVRRFLNE